MYKMCIFGPVYYFLLCRANPSKSLMLPEILQRQRKLIWTIYFVFYGFPQHAKGLHRLINFKLIEKQKLQPKFYFY